MWTKNIGKLLPESGQARDIPKCVRGFFGLWIFLSKLKTIIISVGPAITSNLNATLNLDSSEWIFERLSYPNYKALSYQLLWRGFFPSLLDGTPDLDSCLPLPELKFLWLPILEKAES